MLTLIEKLLNYEYVIFDLDDTIYNRDEFDYRQYFRFFLKYFDNNMACYLADELLTFKRKKEKNYKFLFNDFIKCKKLDINIDEFVQFYHNPGADILHGVDSLYSALNQLRNNKEIYLITNGYYHTQFTKIESLKISLFFKKIFILSPDSQIRMKPEPDVIKFLPIKPEKTVYVGDDIEIDYRFAKNANIDFIHFVFKEDYYAQ